MMRIFFLVFFVFSSSYAQQNVDWQNYDSDSLNRYITIEVNKLRDKKKVPPVVYQPLLSPAATDHSDYMLKKNILTHNQKITKKKTPKNRVDFYGGQFAVVGENVQVLTLNSIPKQFEKKGEPKTIETYELMAKILVLNWKNSPPHYENMIHPNFSGTVTSISVGTDGIVYGCQLLANEPFIHPKKDEALNYIYKSESSKPVYRTNPSLELKGMIVVGEDRSIYFSSHSKKGLKKHIRNFWGWGIAADIVLKSQYLCGTNNAFNGKKGVRGVPMNPLFRKSFGKGENKFKKDVVRIYLGQVPDWIDEEYEVNLTIVGKKRTIINHKFEVIPLEFKLDLTIQPVIAIPSTEITEIIRDTFTVDVLYGKSETELDSDSLRQLLSAHKEKMNTHSKVLIRGFASIEGIREINEKLYLKRAENLASILQEFQIDSNNIQVEVSENFKDFRNDIKGTSFEFLNELEDEELKKIINAKWSDSLEPILKQHRYAKLTLQFQWNDTIGLDVERLKQLFDDAKQKSDIKQVAAIFNYVAGNAQKGKLDSKLLNEFELSETKDFSYQLFQKLLAGYPDTLTQPWWNEEIVKSVYRLVLLNPRQSEVKTYYYWLLYNQAMEVPGSEIAGNIFRNLIVQKNIDATLKARMLVSLASKHDESLLYFGSQNVKEYLHKYIVPVYKKAGLSNDEMILMGQYLYYFGYYSDSKQLLRKGISEQSSIDDIVTYLKIMNDENMGLTRKHYFNLLVNVLEWKKEEFCTIFNSPQLNFQIMDDENIKKLYCENCGAKPAN